MPCSHQHIVGVNRCATRVQRLAYRMQMSVPGRPTVKFQGLDQRLTGAEPAHLIRDILL